MNRREYAGKWVDITNLDTGTKFRVHNGAWDGEVIEREGVKYLSVGNGNKINLSKTGSYELNITIK